MQTTAHPIVYRTCFATCDDLIRHLQECSNQFQPPLACRVVIPEYAEKLKARAATFEAWVKQRLVGLVAIYWGKDDRIQSGFISSVSVVRDYGGQGIASQLLRECLRVATDRWIHHIDLEVSESNTIACRLYRGLGFKPMAPSENGLLMRLELRMTDGK